MILELRRYAVRPGRMPDMHARMRDMLLPMFAANGVPRPIAIWAGDSDWGGAVMSWIVPWESFEVRAATWATFQPLFYAARAAQGGDEFVSRTDLTLIQPWVAAPFGVPDDVPERNGACESLWHVQPRIPLGATFLEQSLAAGFPAIRAAGATGISASNLLFGSLPYVAVIVSWPDPATREAGMARLSGALAGHYAPEVIETARWETLDRVDYLTSWSRLPHLSMS